ncbi:MAG: acyl carrier protein [Oscillospiraceae bacterium]|nr:acyl carrier protein [Oscillospiraceae bacterium]
MTESDIERGLSEVLASYTEFDMKTADRSTSLREDLGLSSFDLITLITQLEERFSISIDDMDILSDIKTFGDAVDMIAGLGLSAAR